MSATKRNLNLSVPPIGAMLVAGEYIVPQDLDFARDVRARDPAFGEIGVLFLITYVPFLVTAIPSMFFVK